MKNTIDNIKYILKMKGHKLTPQRKTILNTIIKNLGKHLTSEEIYTEVKKACPDIGLATVYRTLQLFEGLNIISKIDFGDGVYRYELNTSSDDKHQHHHLICTECGSIFEVKFDLLDSLEERIEKKYDFKIEDHNVKFFGICVKCKQSV